MSFIFNQFVVRPINNNIITNLVMAEIQCFFFIVICCFLLKLINKKIFFHGVRYIYNIADEVASSSINHHEKYMNFLFTLFLFILFTNLFGLIPHVFCFNAHIIVTMTWALIVFFYAIYAGISISFKGFLKNFTPNGINIMILSIITPIKIFSFLTKPLSFAMRLFLNIMAGHIMLGLCEHFMEGHNIFIIFPFFSAVILTMVELVVGFLQAYFFLVSSCILINDALPH